MGQFPTSGDLGDLLEALVHSVLFVLTHTNKSPSTKPLTTDCGSLFRVVVWAQHCLQHLQQSGPQHLPSPLHCGNDPAWLWVAVDSPPLGVGVALDSKARVVRLHNLLPNRPLPHPRAHVDGNFSRCGFGIIYPHCEGFGAVFLLPHHCRHGNDLPMAGQHVLGSCGWWSDHGFAEGA